MTLFAAIGKAQGLDGTEAAIQATDQALSQTGRQNISLAIIAASHDYSPHEVVNGVSGLLSDTHLLGFSTPAQLTADGLHQRSIAVALLVGDQLQAESNWWEEINAHQKDVEIFFHTSITNNPDTKALFVIGEGLFGNATELVDTIPGGRFSLAGCLAGGDVFTGRTYQIGNNGFGSRGFATAVLRGKVNIGIGTNHGWHPVGIYTRITRSKDQWVHTLDDHRACETYSEIYGYSPRDWVFPPLNQLIRLYPLGLDEEGRTPTNHRGYQIRSPLRVEEDGSLRMNCSVPQGKTAYFLVSSIENCVSAVKLATQQAVDALGNAKPVLALIFADIAYHMMLQAQPGLEVQVVQEVIGTQVPIIGGYTFGQIGQSANNDPELLNQHVQIILLGDPEV